MRQDVTDELKRFVDSYNGNKTNIEALSRKIYHVCIDIGSPSSITGMLQSICSGKKKRWSTSWNNAGKKMRLLKSDKIEEIDSVTGHFRWDNKGYLLSENEREHIAKFFGLQVSFSQYDQQAFNFATKCGLTMEIGEPEFKKYFDDDKEERYVFPITLQRGSLRYSFTFGQSIAEQSKVPTLYSVLACLTKYDPGTFEDFCSDYGYDEDSRKAEKTYHAVLNEWKNIHKMFSDCLEELSEIQ